MRQVKCVLFDLDGTLTRSEEGIWRCVGYAAQRMGFAAPDADTLRKFIGPPLLYSFQQYMGMTPEQAELAAKVYRERYGAAGLFENRVYPGIRRLLRMLKTQGVYVAVATGKPEEPSRRIIEHFRLSRWIDRIAGPRDGSADKADIIRRALPDTWDESWMVGDRRFDVEGGRAAGLHTVGVGYGYGTEEELRRAGCEAYAATVEELIGLLCPGQEAPAGAFLSMEGVDGSGKTTQMDLLEDGLDRYGFEVVRSREPGGCPVAEEIRRVLLDRKNVGMTDVTEALLYAASRAQHVRQVVRPAVKAGKVLLSDRFVDSSVAYQGGGRQLGVQRVLDINAPAVDGTLPLCTVYLDIPYREALRRRCAASQPDRIEMEADAFHARVEGAYRELIAREPGRFLCVDATRAPEEIGRDVLEKVLDRLTEAEA